MFARKNITGVCVNAWIRFVYSRWDKKIKRLRLQFCARLKKISIRRGKSVYS